MKKSVLILILFFSILSCSKDDNANSTAEYFTVTNNEVFEYDLGSFGDEDGARISTQAVHYQISQLNRTDKIKYTYKAEPNYVGQDFVRIETTKGSDSSGQGGVIKVVEIRFNIIE